MKRDLAWIELPEDIRSTILRGILDSEIIPNELLGTPSPPENLDAGNDDVINDAAEDDIEDGDSQLVVEAADPEVDDEEEVEQQQV